MENIEKNNISCNFCSSQNLEITYKPKQSKIDLEVGICKECGLVQAVINSEKFEKPVTYS